MNGEQTLQNPRGSAKDWQMRFSSKNFALLTGLLTSLCIGNVATVQGVGNEDRLGVLVDGAEEASILIIRDYFIEDGTDKKAIVVTRNANAQGANTVAPIMRYAGRLYGNSARTGAHNEPDSARHESLSTGPAASAALHRVGRGNLVTGKDHRVRGQELHPDAPRHQAPGRLYGNPGLSAARN